jgi:hypothetical protein
MVGGQERSTMSILWQEMGCVCERDRRSKTATTCSEGLGGGQAWTRREEDGGKRGDEAIWRDVDVRFGQRVPGWSSVFRVKSRPSTRSPTHFQAAGGALPVSGLRRTQCNSGDWPSLHAVCATNTNTLRKSNTRSRRGCWSVIYHAARSPWHRASSAASWSSHISVFHHTNLLQPGYISRLPAFDRLVESLCSLPHVSTR